MRTRTIRLTTTLLVVGALSWLPSPVGATQATRFSSSATALNNVGQIVGEVHVPNSARCKEANGNVCVHAAVFDHGIHDRGTLGGPSSRFWDVNDHGVMVGTSDKVGTDPQTGDPIFHGFSTTASGPLVDLGTLGGRNSEAFGVDEHGDIVGESQPRGNSNYHAFFLPAGGKMRDIGLLPGGTFSAASAISNDGHYVVGFANSAQGFRGFIWDGTTLRDLGTLGGSYSVAWSVNSSGQVVGQTSNRAGDTVAFLWENGHMTGIANLGAGFSVARGINEQGDIVGFGDTRNGRGVGFKTDTSGGPIERFSALAGNFTTLFAINEWGQFVGDADSGVRDPRGEPGFDAVLFSFGHVVDLATGDVN
jgi:probable HAF family extracellular repeat protein